jgi:osmotically-inducible protein OsmY
MQAQTLSHEVAVDARSVRDHDGGLELASRVETRIADVAYGQIRDLAVTCEDGRIVLRGRTRTHHAKQRAQEAALSAAEGVADLANQIVVG